MGNLRGIPHNFVFGDLLDADAVKTFFLKGKLDYVVHLAAVGSVPRSIENPRLSFENNAQATLNVLEACKLQELPILFSSSSSVYGKNPKMPKKETDWLAPMSPYAASKLSAEGMCQAYRESYQMNINVFRLFNVYGPKQNWKGAYAAVIPKWITAAENSEPIVVYGDGEQKRDFTYIKDVVQTFKAVITSQTCLQSPINLAFGKPISLNGILNIFSERYKNIKIEFQPKRTGDILHSEADTSLLRASEVMPANITTIQQGLDETIKWYNSRIIGNN